MDVIGFGALNLDRLYRVERIAREGEHIAIKDMKESPGGSAANTIAGLARLGFNTGFIGAVGDDNEGVTLIEDFRACSVDTRGISILDGRTGVIIGFIDDDGERTLYPYPGVNSVLGEADLDMDYVRNTGFLHLTSFVDEKQFKLQKKLIQKLPDVKISFGPGILYARKGLKALLPVLKKSFVVFLNEVEVKEITGFGYGEGSGLLIEKGAGIVAVTLGKEGCFVRDEGDSHLIPAYSAPVLDSTGAGDAFATGFLYTLLRGGSILDAGREGNRIASLCIQEIGAREGLPYKKNLEGVL
jgi:ribokinase